MTPAERERIRRLAREDAEKEPPPPPLTEEQRALLRLVLRRPWL